MTSLTSMALLWDDPEAAELRVAIDLDITNIENCLSSLQRHSLALKVMSKALARQRIEDLARVAAIEDAAERQRAFALEITPALRPAPKGRKIDA